MPESVVSFSKSLVSKLHIYSCVLMLVNIRFMLFSEKICNEVNVEEEYVMFEKLGSG